MEITLTNNEAILLNNLLSSIPMTIPMSAFFSGKSFSDAVREEKSDLIGYAVLSDSLDGLVGKGRGNVDGILESNLAPLDEGSVSARSGVSGIVLSGEAVDLSKLEHLAHLANDEELIRAFARELR